MYDGTILYNLTQTQCEQQFQCTKDCYSCQSANPLGDNLCFNPTLNSTQCANLNGTENSGVCYFIGVSNSTDCLAISSGNVFESCASHSLNECQFCSSSPGMFEMWRRKRWKFFS